MAGGAALLLKRNYKDTKLRHWIKRNGIHTEGMKKVDSVGLHGWEALEAEGKGSRFQSG